MSLQGQKLRAAKIACVLCMIVCLLLLVACTAQQETGAVISEQEPSVSLYPLTGAYLYADVPVPDGADVFTLNTNMNPKEDDTYIYHSFSLENFTREEADRYIALLEETVIEERESYIVYTESEYPIINYSGWLPGGSVFWLSQSNTDGGIIINEKK